MPLAAGLVVGHLLGITAHERVSEGELERVLVVLLTAAAAASISGAVVGLA